MKIDALGIYQQIADNDKITIACHVAPDGDAIGSTFALAQCLSNMGKKVDLLIGEYNSRYDFVKGKEFIYKGEFKDLSPDLFFALDCGGKSRLGKAEEVFDKAGTTINIDHHISNDEYAKYNYVDTKSSSTCEVVYDIVKTFSTLNKDIATAIYAGILSDTGGFKHNSTTSKTHNVVANLMEFDIDSTGIYSKVLCSHSKEEARVLKKAIENSMIDENIGYTTLTKSEILNDCKAQYTDLDGISEYLLNFDDVEVSAFFYEKNNGNIKVSMRSNGIDVNKIAEKYNGGGHKLAAGALFPNFEEAKSAILNEFKNELR